MDESNYDYDVVNFSRFTIRKITIPYTADDGARNNVTPIRICTIIKLGPG